MTPEEQDLVDRMLEDQGMDVPYNGPMQYHCPDSDCESNDSDDNHFPNLISHGYLGCSPVCPNVTLSICSLAVFCQIHRTCPRFTIQALCKVLCYLHQVPYRPYLFQQLSQAFDLYLDMIHRIDQLLQESMKHDSQEWRLQNKCPACFYRLEDEPELTFNWLVSIDGNNSLKRWDTAVYGKRPQEDHRTARSTYWLTPAEVNEFQYQVKAAQVCMSQFPCHDDDWEDDTTEVQNTFNCVDRWRNAHADVHKKQFSVFEESGIFLSAKYLLAIVNRLLSVYRPKGGCAYNIGCAFSKTASASSIAPKIQALGLRFMVGVFHGHAHNRLCQLDWHPMYIEGTGNTEGEGCEHVFLISNELARSTCHATGFHCHQSVEEHFTFWNEDKYKLLTRFIRNHYHEAMASVHKLTGELEVLKDQLGLTDADFPHFVAEERAYLVSLKQPPPLDVTKTQYVQWVNGQMTGIPNSNSQMFTQLMNQAHIHLDLAYNKLQHAEAFAALVQGQLGLEKPWMIGSELERLVVMRIFELGKLNIVSGYKLRQQISKGLQQQSEAICKVIAQYNIQASKLLPPHLTISWKDIVKYTSLAEFDLLCNSGDDVHDHTWARLAIHEVMTKFFKLCQAKEEIMRLNVEIRCLRTSIHDEEEEIARTVMDLCQSHLKLASELHHRHQSRAAVNALHIHHLDSIESRYGLYSNDADEPEDEAADLVDPGVSAPQSMPPSSSSQDGATCAAGEDPPIGPSRADNVVLDLNTFEELYKLFIDEPGDDELVDSDEVITGIQSMADFIDNIVD
ncbi:hypothetical protein V8E55_006532 [Tylopilus felleus]